MRKLLMLALLATGVSLAANTTWTLQNCAFGDGGIATGSFVWDGSSVVRAMRSRCRVAIPPTSRRLRTRTARPTTPEPLINDLHLVRLRICLDGSPGANRQLRLPVLPLPSGGGTVSLDLSNPAQAECYNCSPYRSFVSGSVTASPGSTTPTAVPTLSDWALTAMAILMFACGLAIIARASRKATAE